MKKVLFNLLNIEAKANILETIKYLSFNASLNLFILTTDKKVTNYFNNKFKNINIINNKELDFDIEISYSSKEKMINENPNLIEVIMYQNIHNKMSYLVNIDVNEFINNHELNHNKILNSLRKLNDNLKDFAYLETNELINKEFDNLFINDHNYKGILDIKNIINNEVDYIYVNKVTFNIIKDAYNAFSSYFLNKKEQKSIGSYFAKMAVSFQKDNNIQFNDSFFKNSVLIDEKSIIYVLDDTLDVTNQLVSIKNILNINN